MAFGAGGTLADPVAVTLSRVSDGDTIRVMLDGREQRVRLYGIDAPEGGQPYGKRATAELVDLVKTGRLAIDPVTRDRYGRVVAKVYADGRDVSLELIKRGAAWHYRRYDKTPAYAAAARRALADKVGLHRNPDAITPWEWRRR